MDKYFDAPFQRVQVEGKGKYRQRKAVQVLTSKRNERVKMLLNSCIRGLNRKGMGWS